MKLRHILMNVQAIRPRVRLRLDDARVAGRSTDQRYLSAEV
jgi:hypothetical protein